MKDIKKHNSNYCDYLARMTLYNYNKNKTKFDYSLIRVELVEINDKEAVFKSFSSDELISVSTDINSPQFYSNKEFTRVLKIFSFDKDKSDFKTNEKEINNTMKNMFFKHYWYKFKFKKLINKKIKMGQFKI